VGLAGLVNMAMLTIAAAQAAYAVEQSVRAGSPLASITDWD
jgi:hypothetical protein